MARSGRRRCSAATSRRSTGSRRSRSRTASRATARAGSASRSSLPQDLEKELDLDLGNIFHNSLSWFFTDDPEEDGTWGVETDMRGVYRCGSSALRGGAVSGVPGFLVARKIFEEERVLVPG